jgi:hypothetical protein
VWAVSRIHTGFGFVSLFQIAEICSSVMDCVMIKLNNDSSLIRSKLMIPFSISDLAVFESSTHLLKFSRLNPILFLAL